MKRVLAWILAFVIYMIGEYSLQWSWETDTTDSFEHPYWYFFAYFIGMIVILWPAIWFWIDKMEDLFNIKQ
jgi:hypothetical protein